MARRLLVFPLPEYGHVSPTLSIAGHYARAGCEVVYLTDPRFAAELRTVGVETVPLLPGETFSTGQQAWTRMTPHGYPGERSKILTERLRAVVEESHFDLLLLDWLLVKSFGCDVAAAVGRRERLYFSTTLVPWKPRPVTLAGELLVLCPGELEIARFRECGPGVHYIEPTFNDAPFGAECEQVPLHDQPLVLAAWGSQSSRYGSLPPLLENIARVASQRPGVQFVVAVGNNPVAKAALEASGAPNLMHCESVQQRKLLARARVMLTHGGMSTIKECIQGEVPMLIFPFLADQPMNAMRVEQAGLGTAIFPEERVASRIAEQLDRALAGSFAPGLERMATIFRRRLEEHPSRQWLDPFLT